MISFVGILPDIVMTPPKFFLGGDPGEGEGGGVNDRLIS